MKRWALLTLFGLCSCSGVSQVYVAADRATFDAIAPAYTAYVTADDGLSEAQKARRLRTVQTWEMRLQAAEESLKEER